LYFSFYKWLFFRIAAEKSYIELMSKLPDNRLLDKVGGFAIAKEYENITFKDFLRGYSILWKKQIKKGCVEEISEINQNNFLIYSTFDLDI